MEKTLCILFRERFSNRKSNAIHNILKGIVRLYFVLPYPCTLSFVTIYVRLNFILRPQVCQIVACSTASYSRQNLQLPIIQLQFSLPLFHSPSLSSTSIIQLRYSLSSFSIPFRSCPFSLLLFFLSSAICFFLYP